MGPLSRADQTAPTQSPNLQIKPRRAAERSRKRAIMAPRHLTLAAFAAALLLAAAPAHATNVGEKPPFTVEDLGTGKGAPANCSFDGGLGNNWVEMTEVSGPGGPRAERWPAIQICGLPCNHRPRRIQPCTPLHPHPTQPADAELHAGELRPARVTGRACSRLDSGEARDLLASPPSL